jgi:hypothetical protein
MHSGMKTAYNISAGTPQGKEHLENLRVEKTTILKRKVVSR